MLSTILVPHPDLISSLQNKSSTKAIIIFYVTASANYHKGTYNTQINKSTLKILPKHNDDDDGGGGGDGEDR